MPSRQPGRLQLDLRTFEGGDLTEVLIEAGYGALRKR
jgi:hypothetical protein